MKKFIAKTSTATCYWDTENDIVWIGYNANPITKIHAVENVETIEKIRNKMNRKKCLVLVDMKKVTDVSKEARDYFANERTSSIQLATALLIGSPVSRIIGNFFLEMSKPICPTKMFTKMDNAIKWLQTFAND